MSPLMDCKVWSTLAPQALNEFFYLLFLILSQSAAFRQADRWRTSGVLFSEPPAPLSSHEVRLCHSQQLWKCNREKNLQSANTSDSKVMMDITDLKFLLPRKYPTSFFYSHKLLGQSTGYIWLRNFKPKLISHSIFTNLHTIVNCSAKIQKQIIKIIHQSILVYENEK